ncbi:N-acetylated-alpha-linked acidic dipeptidase 2-like [Dermacentor variabilis]|uniref:N-acetylated-alpha-linked acidic dipeptidase 2-like n=1 Tax=Dermacentor variabilis TaxID=34621 RepID=UPI003F5C0234
MKELRLSTISTPKISCSVYVYFALKDAARTWFENREPILTTRDLFHNGFLQTVTSVLPKERAGAVLEARVQLSNETIAIFVEEKARLFRHGDPDGPEEKNLPVVEEGGSHLPDLSLHPPKVSADARGRLKKETMNFAAPMVQRLRSSIDSMLAELDAQGIAEYFRSLTAETHLSGEIGGQHAAEYVAAELRRSGLHQVIEVPHRITHAYPDTSNANKLQLLEANGTVLHEATFIEKKETGKMSVVTGYLAFSPNGSVEADLVFVNYGRREDMDQLEGNGVVVKGRICLARFGGSHPVDKGRSCHERGGVGLLVFADPEDVAPLGPEKVYPKTAFVDGSALQRGSLYHYGDPETPGYPSVDKAVREEDTSNLSPIPALVIGYDDAAVFLESLGGKDLGWKGGLNATYKAGPLFPEGRKVSMSVSSKRVTRLVKSVLGVVKGSGETDRFVITGAHHDSWGYGAVEPSSATAALLELGRALGNLIKRGWSPRRTIVLASWAAGQMAFAGSSEWVEENIVLLDSGAVGYVSVDSCVSGPRFAVHASPTLRDVVYKAAKQVPKGSIKLMNAWEKAEGTKRPRIPLIHGVGDHAAFSFYAGIPSVEFTFRPKEVSEPPNSVRFLLSLPLRTVPRISKSTHARCEA